MKRLFALLLCLCLCLALIPAAAAEDIEIVDIEPVEAGEVIELVDAEAVPNAKPSISSSPKSVTAYLGTTVKFTVKASGAESYQWYYRTSAEGSWAKSTSTGAKTATLSIVAEAKRNGYQYRCKVSNADGYSYTKNATLTVSKKPVVTEQPADAVALAGETVKFTVKADGATSYQWYYRKTADGSWNKSSGATGASLSVEVKSYRDGYQYRCKLTNANGYVYSEAATLSLLSKPKISTQPFSYTACVGATVYFKVQADVADSYQWYYRTSENGSWKTTSLTGCKTATLTVKVTAARDGWQYRCKLTNSQGSSYSDPARLTVSGDLCGEGLTWKFGGDGLLTISGTGEMYDYRSGGHDRPPWYSKRDRLLRVSVGSGVTRVGNFAFQDCGSLTEATIGSGVTAIGVSAFYSCGNLTSVTIGSGVKSIEGSAFSYCGSLTGVKLPAGLEEIGDNAFDACGSLTGVTIPDSVTSLGAWAFNGCSSLKTVKIGKGVTVIDEGTFDSCGALASLTIPSGVTSIGDWAFSRCSGLTSLTIPSSVTSIGGAAFEFCSGLTSVTIPNSVTSIGGGVFRGCSALRSAYVGNGVTRLGAFYSYGFFESCSSLTSVTIPVSVTVISDRAFRGCSSLSDVYYKGTKTQWGKITVYDENEPLLNATIHYNA